MTKVNEQVSSFAATLPASYRRSYSDDQIARHASLAAQRQGLVTAGFFGTRGELSGLCIVASDQPGLLSRISEAFVICGLDVVNAEAFTRNTTTGPEAVDLFWVERRRGASRELGPEDAEKLRATVLGLLSGVVTASDRAAKNTQNVTSSNSRVRFLEDESGALCTLEIETDDRSGLLLSLARTLYAQAVQILRSEVRTRSGRVIDRFSIAELNGEPVEPGRRLEIQMAVLSAAEPAKRLSSLAPPHADA